MDPGDGDSFGGPGISAQGLHENPNPIADKFNKIIVSLWLTEEFKSQGPPLAAGAMQMKFKNLLKAFRDKHGLSEYGERSNLSAIEENRSEMDMNLETIHDELEVNRIAAE